MPLCHGHNPTAAATAKAEGLRHYRASKREGRGDAEMTTALGFFDAACAAGDDSALELRAYALAGVERFVEAAESLDAFVAAHPLATLPAATRARIASQEPAIVARVASLVVESVTPGAKVTINHQPYGTTPTPPIRLSPGPYEIEVTADGQAPITRTLDLDVGDRIEKFGPAKGAAGVAGAGASHPSGGAGQTNDAARAADGTRGASTGRPQLKPWLLGTGIGAGVFVLGGVAGAIWAGERDNLYASNNCAVTQKPGCSSVQSEGHAARGIEVTGFVVGGLGAVATGVLFYLEHGTSAPRPPQPLSGEIHCTLPGAAIACGGSF